MKTDLTRRIGSGPGFTLVEAAIAVGITATAVVALIGMLPLAIDGMHKSALTTAEARIVQAITSDYQARDWSKEVLLPRSTDPYTYYDDHGIQVSSSALNQSYIGCAQVTDAPLLPGTGNSTNKRMRKVLIRIINGTDTTLFGIPSRVSTYTIVVAQMDNYSGIP